jgi:hypothetical protein
VQRIAQTFMLSHRRITFSALPGILFTEIVGTVCLGLLWFLYFVS